MKTARVLEPIFRTEAADGGCSEPEAIEMRKALAQDEAVRALLTTEQQGRFDAMKALREDGMRGGRPPGRRRSR